MDVAAMVFVIVLLRNSHMEVAAWLSGRLVALWSRSVLVSINEVTLRRARLVLGWVTVCKWVKHLGL